MQGDKDRDTETDTDPERERTGEIAEIVIVIMYFTVTRLESVVCRSLASKWNNVHCVGFPMRSIFLLPVSIFFNWLQCDCIWQQNTQTHKMANRIDTNFKVSASIFERMGMNERRESSPPLQLRISNNYQN